MKTKGYLWGLWISLCFVACSEKGANVLELSTTELQLDANGTRQRVTVLTDSDFWQVTGSFRMDFRGTGFLFPLDRSGM